jgi:outer membrane protein assembly factor BamB
MKLNGQKTFVYCADKGVVGVSADDGRLLWETTDWKISIATVPSPLVMGDGRVFLSGGYTAGSMMLQVHSEDGEVRVEPEFRLKPSVFGAIQQTPILYENYIYGVREDGRFVCITPDGKPVWASGAGQQFGLGPFLIGDGVILAVNDTGLLRLLEASPAGYQVLAQAQVLKGRESWAPLALAGGRLLVRDLTRLVCLDVARK